jgi:hypothetical protein
VSRTLHGAKRRFGVLTTRKLPLTRENLLTVCNAYHDNPSHDDILFVTQILTGTECLMRLGELTWPARLSLCDYRKVSMCHTVSFHADALSFWLPGHKADQFFEGNRLIVHKSLPSHAYLHFKTHLSSCNFLFHAGMLALNCGCVLMGPSPHTHGSSIVSVNFSPTLLLGSQCVLAGQPHLPKPA